MDSLRHKLVPFPSPLQTPFLIKGQLREYQQIGLDWLVSLYHKRLNGAPLFHPHAGAGDGAVVLVVWLAGPLYHKRLDGRCSQGLGGEQS